MIRDRKKNVLTKYRGKLEGERSRGKIEHGFFFFLALTDKL